MDEWLPSPSAPWAVPAFQTPAPFPEGSDWLLARLSAPAPEVRQELEEREFAFVSEAACLERSETLAAATAQLDAVPALALAIRTHVRGISLLDAEEAYDVTHSEPRWPDWIFVSCPAHAGEQSALRAAENVLHEAMHLQLTRIERRVHLVGDEKATLHSPWKGEARDLRGILHGLYVFQSIMGFLNVGDVLRGLGRDGLEYRRRRTDDIGDEVNSLPLRELREGLTPAGKAFLDRISQ